MKRIIATTCLVFLLLTQAHAFQARVVGVLDGDTIDVLANGNHQMRCRLYGVDAPEKAQPFGMQSKKSLSDMVYGREIEIQVMDQDRYGRSICRLRLNGTDINREQVARGYAWMYRQYTQDPSYAHAEASAQQARLGLWADTKRPVEPWNWRQSQK